MNKVEKNRIEEIGRLHSEILNSLKMSLGKAIRIGELLTEQKEVLKHGKFTAWVNDNLPFTDRTARNYMRVYQERDRLKTETVSDLTAAYNLLIESSDSSKIGTHEELLKRREEAIAKQEQAIGEQRECEKKMVKLLNPEQRLNEIFRLLNTDYYELTEVGLKRHRELTKEDWEQYGECLRLAFLIQ